MALFQFTYTCFELTFINWIVTFVLKERHGGPNSGYVSSGFWGGYTAGRLILIPLTKMVRLSLRFPILIPSSSILIRGTGDARSAYGAPCLDISSSPSASSSSYG